MTYLIPVLGTTPLNTDEDNILRRLEHEPRVAYVIDPQRQAAARALRDRGLISIQIGEGQDRGILICRPVAGALSRSAPIGGDAA